MPLTLEPLSGACGAAVTGVDLGSDALDLDELRSAVRDHLVVVFPRQTLSRAELSAVARRLGPASPTPFIQPVADHPDLILVARQADEPPAFDPAGGWHSDYSFLPEPPSYTLLMAVDVPEVGGDTIWANQYLAYRSLSAPMQRVVAQLAGIHSAAGAFAPSMQGSFDALAEASVVTGPEALDRQVHPAVVVHPETGQPCLYLNPEYTIGLEGFATEEARPILSFLAHHATRPEFTCRWRWSPGDVAIWDNRCLQHMAMPDYRGEARRMLRATVAGERPVAATRSDGCER